MRTTHRAEQSIGTVKESRVLWVLILLAAAAAYLGLVAPAQASYSGRDGEITYEVFSSSTATPGAPLSATDRVQTTSRTLESCADDGTLACTLGAPSYSPTGALVVMARQRPSDPQIGRGAAGRLQLVDADGSDSRLLPRQTADDEQPAFSSDGEIVFTGRVRPGGTPNLYEVSTSGRGRRQLTFRSGSQAAPCRSGAIAFSRDGNVYLLGARGGVTRLTYSGGSEPSCAPDSDQIAYVHAGRLFEVGVDGKGSRQVCGLAAQSPSYAPDGSQIAFVHPRVLTGRVTEDQLVIVDQAGREMQPPSTLATSDLSAGNAPQLRGHVAGLAWQPGTKHETAIYAAPAVPVFSGQPVVQVSAGANEGLIAARNRSGAVVLFAVRRSPRPDTVPRLQRFATLTAEATQVAISPYERRLAVADADGTVSVYRVSDQERMTLIAHRQVGQVSALDFSANANLIAVAPLGRAKLPAPASAFAFSVHSNRLAVGGTNGVAVFSVAPSGALSEPQSALTGPSKTFGFNEASNLTSWQAGPDALFGFSTRTDTLRPLPGAPPLPAEQVMGTNMTVSAAYDSSLNVLAGIDGNDHTVQLATVSASAAAVRQGVLATGARSIAFSDNGNMLAVGDLNGRLSMFYLGIVPQAPQTSPS
jgi:WD40 repeat protein